MQFSKRFSAIVGLLSFAISLVGPAVTQAADSATFIPANTPAPGRITVTEVTADYSNAQITGTATLVSGIDRSTGGLTVQLAVDQLPDGKNTERIAQITVDHTFSIDANLGIKVNYTIPKESLGVLHNGSALVTAEVRNLKGDLLGVNAAYFTVANVTPSLNVAITPGSGVLTVDNNAADPFGNVELKSGSVASYALSVENRTAGMVSLTPYLEIWRNRETTAHTPLSTKSFDPISLAAGETKPYTFVPTLPTAPGSYFAYLMFRDANGVTVTSKSGFEFSLPGASVDLQNITASPVTISILGKTLPLTVTLAGPLDETATATGVSVTATLVDPAGNVLGTATKTAISIAKGNTDISLPIRVHGTIPENSVVKIDLAQSGTSLDTITTPINTTVDSNAVRRMVSILVGSMLGILAVIIFLIIIIGRRRGMRHSYVPLMILIFGTVFFVGSHVAQASGTWKLPLTWRTSLNKLSGGGDAWMQEWNCTNPSPCTPGDTSTGQELDVAAYAGTPTSACFGAAWTPTAVLAGSPNRQECPPGTEGCHVDFMGGGGTGEYTPPPLRRLYSTLLPYGGAVGSIDTSSDANGLHMVTATVTGVASAFDLGAAEFTCTSGVFIDPMGFDSFFSPCGGWDPASFSVSVTFNKSIAGQYYSYPMESTPATDTVGVDTANTCDASLGPLHCDLFWDYPGTPCNTGGGGIGSSSSTSSSSTSSSSSSSSTSSSGSSSSGSVGAGVNLPYALGSRRW